jgi:hypothetical protein
MFRLTLVTLLLQVLAARANADAAQCHFLTFLGKSGCRGDKPELADEQVIGYPWGSKAGAPEPKVWQHDVFRKDRTPYDPREIEGFQRTSTESKQTAPRTSTGKQP